MIYKLKSNRVYRSYFGGKRLDALCDSEICEDTQFPEEWIASTVRAFNAGREDIVEGLSITEDGKVLADIINQNPEKILGEEMCKKYNGKMSILVKLLDAAERLFIQCHPTVPFAKQYFNSDFGKTECWYILEADENACVYLGFKPEITKAEWKDCFKIQNVDRMLELMHCLKVKKGDLIFVEGGVPHAIGGGCLLCELQEPTDYMVIPERTSKSGITLADAKMHGGLGWEKMFDCFCYDGVTEEELRNKFVSHKELIENEPVHIVDNSLTDKFKMDCLKLNGKFTLKSNPSYMAAVVTRGELTMNCESKETEFHQGEQCFISADSGDIVMSGNADLMICMP